MNKVALKSQHKYIRFIAQLFINQPAASMGKKKTNAQLTTRLTTKEIFLSQLADKAGWG